MKKYIIILVTTVVMAKLFAASVMKFMPKTEVFFEKNAFHKVLTLFNNHESNPSEHPKVVIPKFTFNRPHILTVVENKKQKAIENRKKHEAELKAAAEKKIADVKADEERRKERKKKLEQSQSNDKTVKDATKQTQQPTAPTYVAPKMNNYEQLILGPAIQQVAAAPAPTLTNPTATAKPSPSPTDINAWEKTLLANPTTAEFKTFLNLYKTSQITATQYYTVVKALQQAADPNARNLAVMGASVEANPTAFQILADETYNERVAAIQSLALQRLQVYANVQYLSVMSQAMTSSDINTKSAVTSFVGQIAAALKGNPSSVTSATKSLLAVFAADFNQYLKSNATSQSNPSLTASTQQALANVQAVLGLS